MHPVRTSVKAPPPHDSFPRDNFDAYTDAPGEYRMPAGPFKGKRLDELPDVFLHHVAAKNWHPEVREFALRVMAIRADEHRADEDPTEPAPILAAIALPGVIFRWRESMLAEFGDNDEALAVVDRGLERLKQLCSQFTRKPWLELAEV